MYKYFYMIEGLNGSYESLAEARSMVRHYLKKDSREATVLRGMNGMKRNYIHRINIDNGATKLFKW